MIIKYSLPETFKCNGLRTLPSLKWKCNFVEIFITGYFGSSLQWRHNGRDGVSIHQPHDCLLNRLLFRRRSKKTSKLRVTGLCAGNSPMTGEFPLQRVGQAEDVSIWWRHHVSFWQRAVTRISSKWHIRFSECSGLGNDLITRLLVRVYSETRNADGTIQWRHECDDVLNHWRLDCLPKRLFRRRSKETSKLRVTGLFEGNSPVTGEFPA